MIARSKAVRGYADVGIALILHCYRARGNYAGAIMLTCLVTSMGLESCHTDQGKSRKPSNGNLRCSLSACLVEHKKIPEVIGPCFSVSRIRLVFGDGRSKITGLRRESV
jgi:hypothetical protein